MHGREAAGVVAAAAEGRLELSAEVLAVGMAQQESGKSARIRGDIKSFVPADPRKGAGGNIADGVPAGLARGDLGCRQAAHQGRGVVDMNVVQLEVLPRRDVGDSVRVFFRKIRHRLKLLGVEAATGDLDALHARGIPQRIRAFGQFTRWIG